MFAQAAIQTVSSSFMDKGILGATVIVLAGVVVFMYKQLVNAQKINSDLQEKRLQDTIDVRDKYAENIQKFSQTTELLYNKLNSKEK